MWETCQYKSMHRRTWLKLGLGAAIVLAVTGGAIVLAVPGLEKSGALSAAGKTVFAAIGRATLQGSLPKDAAQAQKALNDLLERVGILTSHLPPHAQDELSQLLALLHTGAGRIGLAGLSSEWAEASDTDIQQALQSMRVSRLELKRQAYQALHDIVGAAYFSDSSTWGLLGYPGPMKI